MADEKRVPMMWTWNGRKIEELSREELLLALRDACEMISIERGRADGTRNILRALCVRNA